MKYSQETYEKAINALEALKPAVTENEKLTVDFIVAALRAQQERENSKPLTLDELREMGGEPVWCKGKSRFGVNFEAWKVLSKYSSTEEVIRFTDGDDRLPESYGKTWLAYRYKKEEAQDER